MDYTLFGRIYVAAVSFVVLEGIIAYRQKFFREHQMEKRYSNGFSFLSHGGMWADVTAVPILVGYINSAYELKYLSLASLVIFVLSAGAWLYLLLGVYKKLGLEYPEAFAHDGRITIIGWIHYVYAVGATWSLGMFYFTRITPHARLWDIIWITGVLHMFFYLGVAKFTRRWVLTADAKRQVQISIVATSIVAFVKLVWF